MKSHCWLISVVSWEIEKMPAIRRNCGQRWFFVACSIQLVAATGAPPVAATRRGSQMAMGKDDQAIPVPGPAAPFGAGQSTWTAQTRGVDGFELTIGKENRWSGLSATKGIKRPPLSRLGPGQ